MSRSTRRLSWQNLPLPLLWPLRTLVIITSVALMTAGAWGHSVTTVEFAHLPSGLAAWQHHSFGIYRVCAPLSKLLYSLPASLSGIHLDYPQSYDADPTGRPEWFLGVDMQEQYLESYHSIFRYSRLLPILVTVLGACIACDWSTRLFGAWPGMVSLCLWSFMPAFIGHGPLLTSDVPSAVATLLAARCFWAFNLRPRMLGALASGLTLGLAVGTKFTLLLLYPSWLAILSYRALRMQKELPSDPQQAGPTRTWFLTLGLLVFLSSILVINCLYFFRGVGFRLSQFGPGMLTIGAVLRELGAHRATAWLLQVPMPFPLEFLRGLDYQLWDTQRDQEAYLLGRTRLGGWWYWYAMAFLIKTPVSALFLFGLSILQIPNSLRNDKTLWGALCLLIPAAEIALAISSSTGSGTNAAFRYLIPSLGLLCVWVGSVAQKPSRLQSLVVFVLLSWLTLDSFRAYPDHLGWQNDIGRLCSPERPALIGDSLDWGQDLARLSTWIRSHSKEGETLVCVYGLGSIEPYGVRPPIVAPTSEYWARFAFVAISANILFGYEHAQCIEVGHVSSPLTRVQRQLILNHKAYAKVGRTIFIFRIRDLLHEG